MTFSFSTVAREADARSMTVFVPFVAMTVAFFVLPALAGRDVSMFSVYSAIQVFSVYGLLALALGLTMVAGQFDLSTLGMFALGGVVAVGMGENSPVLGLVVAAVVGAIAGLVQGGIVAGLKVNSISVTLGGLLVLTGIARAIGSDTTVSYNNLDFSVRLDAPRLEIFSWHSLAVILCFVLVGMLMRFTVLGRDLRAVGGDLRGSRVAGVRTDSMLLGVFVVSGVLSAIAGSLSSFGLAAAIPNPGFAPLIFATTAAILGGVALSGGRGSALGIAVGVLTLSLLQAVFGILASPGWVTSVVTGGLLTLAAVIAGLRLREVVIGARRRLGADRGASATGG